MCWGRKQLKPGANACPWAARIPSSCGLIAEMTVTWQKIPKCCWDAQPYVVLKQHQTSARNSLELTKKGEATRTLSGRQKRRETRVISGWCRRGAAAPAGDLSRASFSGGQLRASLPATHITDTAACNTKQKWTVGPESLDCTLKRKEPSHMGLPLTVAIPL